MTEDMNQKNTETETQNVHIDAAVSAGVRDKIIRLFTYLEKAFALDDAVIRDFRSSITPPSPWWLADYPRDLENLYIRSFDTGRETDDGQSHAWVRVQKKNIELAPALPERLVEWISEMTPLEKPKALEKIDRKVRFDSDKKRESDFDEFCKNFEQGDTVPQDLADWVVSAP